MVYKLINKIMKFPCYLFIVTVSTLAPRTINTLTIIPGDDASNVRRFFRTEENVVRTSSFISTKHRLHYAFFTGNRQENLLSD